MTIPEHPLKATWRVHRGTARYSGAGYDLSFEEWLRAWEESGRLPERGRKAHEYRMVRKDASRPFSPDNIEIITNAERYARMDRAYSKAPEWRAKISLSHRGKTLSEATRQKMSLQRRGRELKWPRAVEIEGIAYASLTQAAKALGISPPALSQRLKTGRYPYKLL